MDFQRQYDYLKSQVENEEALHILETFFPNSKSVLSYIQKGYFIDWSELTDSGLIQNILEDFWDEFCNMYNDTCSQAIDLVSTEDKNINDLKQELSDSEPNRSVSVSKKGAYQSNTNHIKKRRINRQLEKKDIGDKFNSKNEELNMTEEWLQDQYIEICKTYFDKSQFDSITSRYPNIFCLKTWITGEKKANSLSYKNQNLTTTIEFLTALLELYRTYYKNPMWPNKVSLSRQDFIVNKEQKDKILAKSNINIPYYKLSKQTIVKNGSSYDAIYFKSKTHSNINSLNCKSDNNNDIDTDKDWIRNLTFGAMGREYVEICKRTLHSQYIIFLKKYPYYHNILPWVRGERFIYSLYKKFDSPGADVYKKLVDNVRSMVILSNKSATNKYYHRLKKLLIKRVPNFEQLPFDVREVILNSCQSSNVLTHWENYSINISELLLACSNLTYSLVSDFVRNYKKNRYFTSNYEKLHVKDRHIVYDVKEQTIDDFTFYELADVPIDRIDYFTYDPIYGQLTVKTNFGYETHKLKSYGKIIDDNYLY